MIAIHVKSDSSTVIGSGTLRLRNEHQKFR